MQKQRRMRRTKLPDVDAFESKLYADMKALLVKSTNKFSEKTGLPYDELSLQADMLFVQALRRFDESFDCSFSTFLFSALRNGLIDFSRELCDQDALGTRVLTYVDADGVEHDPIDSIECEAANIPFNRFHAAAGLSDDAKTLISLALSGGIASLHLLQAKVKKLKWESERFTNAFLEVREMVNAWN